MKTTTTYPSVLAFAISMALLPNTPAMADEKVAHIGKHVHGEAIMNIVIENHEEVIIELDSPAMNILGFEHEPSTLAQAAAVETNEKILADAELLFAFQGSHCKPHKVDIDMPFDEHHDDEDHDHDHKAHKHDDHDHDHKHHDDDDYDHDHEAHKHDDHDHDHKHHDDDDHDHDHDAHSDIAARYVFDCQNTADVRSLTVNMFDAFSGLEKVDVQWIGHNLQGSEVITPNHRQIEFD